MRVLQEYKKGKRKKSKGVDVTLTQNEMILKYIHDYGSITQLEALKEFGCMRLASRINDLKNQGYNIVSEKVSIKNRYGKKISFAKYSIIESEVL
jgi:hypothetical protein